MNRTAFHRRAAFAAAVLLGPLLAGCDTLVHLVGVSHPSPAKAAQFRAKAASHKPRRAGDKHVGHPVSEYVNQQFPDDGAGNSRPGVALAVGAAAGPGSGQRDGCAVCALR